MYSISVIFTFHHFICPMLPLLRKQEIYKFTTSIICSNKQVYQSSEEQLTWSAKMA